MDEAFLTWRFRPELWAASAAMAIFAAYVALDLARGVSSRLALGAGTWAAHFIAVANEPLPFSMRYHGGWVFAAFALALVSSVVGVHMSARPRLGMGRVVLAAVGLGLGACGVPFLGLHALQLAPPPHWNPLWLAAGAALASLCAGLALGIVAEQRRRRPQLSLRWQACVALGLGAAIAIGNAAVLHAASLPLLTLSLADAPRRPPCRPSRRWACPPCWHCC
jgi:NO-binding membrane sensor protein with MHYT domain